MTGLPMTDATPMQRRNLKPTPEAVVAMYWWSKDYARQGGGSMDFYDALPEGKKRFCQDFARDVLKAANRSRTCPSLTTSADYQRRRR